MVRGDGGGHVGSGPLDERDRLARGDVLQHHLETRKTLNDAPQMPLDEHRLAVEHVDLRIGHLAVQQQRQADLLHGREHCIAAREIGDTK